MKASPDPLVLKPFPLVPICWGLFLHLPTLMLGTIVLQLLQCGLQYAPENAAGPKFRGTEVWNALLLYSPSEVLGAALEALCFFKLTTTRCELRHVQTGILTRLSNSAKKLSLQTTNYKQWRNCPAATYTVYTCPLNIGGFMMDHASTAYNFLSTVTASWCDSSGHFVLMSENTGAHPWLLLL